MKHCIDCDWNRLGKCEAPDNLEWTHTYYAPSFKTISTQEKLNADNNCKMYFNRIDFESKCLYIGLVVFFVVVVAVLWVIS